MRTMDKTKKRRFKEEQTVTVDYSMWSEGNFHPAEPRPPEGEGWRLVSVCPEGEALYGERPVQFYWARDVEVG